MSRRKRERGRRYRARENEEAEIEIEEWWNEFVRSSSRPAEVCRQRGGGWEAGDAELRGLRIGEGDESKRRGGSRGTRVTVPERRREVSGKGPGETWALGEEVVVHSARAGGRRRRRRRGNHTAHEGRRCPESERRDEGR